MMLEQQAVAKTPWQAAARQLDLWSLLVWTYARQKAHIYLKNPMDWFLWALSDAELVKDMPRPRVHADAAAVHAAVMEMGQAWAESLVYFAANATQPEPPTATPRPYPVRVDRGMGLGAGERWQRAVIEGRWTDYLVRWNEQTSEVEAVVKKTGRNRYKKVGDKIVQKPVEFCPLDWQPDLVWVISLATIYEDWRRGMTLLSQKLATTEFRDHALSGKGFTNEPMAVELQDLIAARGMQLRMAYGVTPVSVKHQGGAIQAKMEPTDDGEAGIRFYRKWASARGEAK